MKTTLALAALFLGVAGLRADDGMFSNLKFEEAKAEAARDKKLVLIDFFTTWCGPCKMLDKQTWANKEVAELAQSKAVCLRLDAEKELKLAADYHIEAYPTVLILKPDGKEVDRLVGFRDPKTFMADFNATLAGKDSLTRAKEAVGSAGEDPTARMKYGQALAEKQKYAEALEAFLWCFDNGAKDPAFVGVRASFLLADIMNMSHDYPPAKAALEKRRDEDAARVRVGTATTEQTFDAVNLNRALGQADKNLALYDLLPAGHPARKAITPLIFGELLAAHRYKDVLDGADPLAEFGRQVDMFNRTLPFLRQQPANREQLEKMQRQYTVTRGTDWLEALAGAKNNPGATALAVKILKFDDTAETRDALVAAADRAGNGALAAELKGAK